MSNHTRRQFLGLVASLLTLLDAVRRFFKPPEVVDVRTRMLRGSGGGRGKFLVEEPLHDVDGKWVGTRVVMSKADAERTYGLKPGTLDSL